MPGILAPGEGPETWGEPGHWPLWPGDIMAYGELGSRGPRVKDNHPLDTQKDATQDNKNSQAKYISACPRFKGLFVSCLVKVCRRFSVQPVPAFAQQSRITISGLLLTVGTGKAGLAHGYAQGRWRRGGPERRGCPESSTRGARGMDVPCTHTHTHIKGLIRL